MKEIVTFKGEIYKFNEDTRRIFKDGVLLSSSQAEPIYSSLDDNGIPEFSGLYLKDIDSILSLSGKINKITNINSIK